MTDVRIITEALGGSALSRAIQSGEAPSSWIADAPSGLEGWRHHAAQRVADQDWRARWRRLAPAFDARGAARGRLERVIAGGGVAVSTGQQPGLFGGPIYTLSKAVSAIALADALERLTGVLVVPVFWAATDDADFAEASVTAVARRGGLEVLRSANAPPTGTPMSLAQLGDVTELLARLAAASGSAAESRVLELVREAYSGDAKATVGGSFVRFMRTLLEPLGMAVLDASHEAVAAESRSTLSRALDMAPEIERALAERSRSIRDVHFEPQVEDVKGLSLVFTREGSIKRRLAVGESGVRDAVLTPNVLLRPIVEHEILPTLCYVAGPGELAYFAQVSAVAETLRIATPVAEPRWSCTLVEPHVAELLARLDTSERELTDPNALESRLARASLDDDATKALARLRSAIAAVPDSLRGPAAALDLERAVQGAAGAMLHRAERLERRFLAAVKRRETALMTDVATLRAALRPRGARQERVLSPIPILARHGMALLDEMIGAASPHAERIVAGTRR